MEMDPAIKEMTFRGESLETIRSTAISTGSMRGLIHDGARKVLEGTTSVSEVMRVAGPIH